MTSHRNKIIYVLLGVIVCLLISWGVGAGLLKVMGLPIVDATPLTLLQYAYYYHDMAIVQRSFLIVLGAPLLLIVIAIVIFIIPKKEKLYGDAKWASQSDIKKAGLFSEQGIVLGKKNGRYIRMDGDKFALVAAPTRSGKGVGIVIPNLLSWNSSAVVLDIKSENFELTSGYRQAHGQSVYFFNPAPSDYKTHRYNPLFYVSEDPNKRIDDVQKITNYLIPTSSGENMMWSNEGRDLLFGVILAVISIDKLPTTLSEVLRQLKTETETAAHLSALIKEHADVLPKVCVQSLNNFINKASKERSGVKSEATSALTLFTNPLIEAATSGNDFDFRLLRQEKMTIYIGIQPNDLERLAPLVNLFIQQLIDQNTQEMPAHYEKGRLVRGNPTLKHSVLLLLDEFTSIGRITILEKSIAFISGYGIRLLTIVQSPSQIRSTYGSDVADTFEKNHAARVIFRPDTMQDAEQISNELGQVTVVQESTTRQNHKLQKTTSKSYTKRQLLLAQEVKSLKETQALVFIGGCPVMLVDKIAYYKDKAFKFRYRDVVDIPTLIVENRAENDFDFSFIHKGLKLPDQHKKLTNQEVSQFCQFFFDEVTITRNEEEESHA